MTPKISVVIPAFNEEKLLPKCLKSLQEQTYEKEQFEVIVADNASTDKTVQIAKECGAKVYTYSAKQGCSPTRIFGVSKAKGEILAFTDADSTVPKDWLATIDRLFTESGIVCIGGKALPDKRNITTNVVFSFYNAFHIVNHRFGKPILWGFNMAVKRSAYDEIKGFNPSLLSSEDWDLAFRLQKRFGRNSVQYVPDLVVHTSTRKQHDAKILWKYSVNGVINYTNFVLLGKTKAIPVFNAR